MRSLWLLSNLLGHMATHVYNNAGQVTDQTDRDGRRTTFSYDSGGRETGETWLTSSGGTLRTDYIHV